MVQSFFFFKWTWSMDNSKFQKTMPPTLIAGLQPPTNPKLPVMAHCHRNTLFHLR